MKLLSRSVLPLIASLFALNAQANCDIPADIEKIIIQKGISNLKNYPDIHRNYKALHGLCVNLLSFREASIVWKMFLITNPSRSRGPFWFLPHDNENSAFSAAVYATKHYGGGFLAVYTGDRRYNMGQDPNRNFANSSQRICREQKAPSPLYTNRIFSIIDYYKTPTYPYLALHNNTNRGGVSIFKDSQYTQSFLAYSIKKVKKGIGLADEDSIVYIAGSSPTPPKAKVEQLLSAGLNTKYEYVNRASMDCSMSNYVVSGLGTSNYYNIETQHGKTATQIKMINRLLTHIGF